MKQAPEQFRFAALAVDIPVFGFKEDELHVLIDDVDRPPHYKNVKGFLGGMVLPSETAEETVQRVLKEKGNISRVYLEQLYTFSAVNRDKRNRVVSVAYIGLVSPDMVASYSHPSARFAPVQPLRGLAYDHDEILQVALNRLRGKLSYTTIAQFLLSKTFTLTELQQVYESLQKTELDKRNFRKKILSMNIIKETGDMQTGLRSRPAALYTFISPKLKEISSL